MQVFTYVFSLFLDLSCCLFVSTHSVEFARRQVSRICHLPLQKPTYICCIRFILSIPVASSEDFARISADIAQLITENKIKPITKTRNTKGVGNRKQLPQSDQKLQRHVFVILFHCVPATREPFKMLSLKSLTSTSLDAKRIAG